MSNSFNRTVIIGRLGKNPEMRKSRNDNDFVVFPIANNIRTSDGEETQWHNIKVFGNQAVTCHKYLVKGDLCCIEGRIDIQTYEKDGETRKAQSIIAEKVVFLSSSRRRNENQEASEQQCAN